MKDVMLDFETLGNGKDKCVCQVAAVYFDRMTGELGASYKATIFAGSHIALGGKIDADTVYWWLKQSQEARNSILNPTKNIVEAMSELNEFLIPSARIWSHATFDFVTLMDTMKQCGIKPTFTYKHGLDIRTLVYLANVSFDKTPREGVHHDALDDCKHQVKYCVAALNTLKTNKILIKKLYNLLEEE